MRVTQLVIILFFLMMAAYHYIYSLFVPHLMDPLEEHKEDVEFLKAVVYFILFAMATLTWLAPKS